MKNKKVLPILVFSLVVVLLAAASMSSMRVVVADSPAQEPTPTWQPIIPYDGTVSTLLQESYRDKLKGSVINPPRDVGDFTLPSTTGEDFTLSKQGGKIIMLYFGYLTCPDVCPTTMVDMKRAYEAVGATNEDMMGVFITIDPERDTMDILQRYVNAFNQDFIGLRPESQEQLNDLLTRFGITVERREVDSAVGYLIDHRASVILVGPDGRVYSELPFGVSYEEIANDLQVLLDYIIPNTGVVVNIDEIVPDHDPAREFRIVIPKGTGLQIAMGQDPGIIPLNIQLTLGVQDILVLENHDEIDYLVGGVWVAPNETVSKQFYEPQTFVGLCTVTVGRDLVEIVVSEP